MKKAFTLVELMVVAVVLVILMTFMVKLAGIGGDSASINATVDRMHRLENALSGYYAAFGTYPPVKLHGNRNPFLAVNDYGDQSQDGQENMAIWSWLSADGKKITDGQAEADAWNQVRAACVAQPVACEFPFPKNLMKEYVDQLNKKMKKAAEDMDDERAKRIFGREFDDGVSDRIGRFAPYMRESNWSIVQLFRFGLMSFLLPRYLVMMNSHRDLFESYFQWTGNNTLPRDPLTGSPMPSWSYLQENFITKVGRQNSDIAHVANIPSQAACARWMASFDRVLTCHYPIALFGVNIWEHNEDYNSIDWGVNVEDVHAPGGFEEGDTGSQYILDMVTMRDGWGHDFFYYSPAPYQSYRLWSAGPNGRTFPPWISRDNLGGDANRCIGYWIKDDIVNLSK